MESSKKHFQTAGRKTNRFSLALALISLLVAVALLARMEMMSREVWKRVERIEADSKTMQSIGANHKVEAQSGSEDFHDDEVAKLSEDESRKRRGLEESATATQISKDESRKENMRWFYRPTITLVPATILTSKETTVAFYCWLNGGSARKITWDKLDGSLPQNSVIKGGVLQIIKTERNNSGLYVCKATTKAGNKLTAVSTLTIKEAPSFTNIPPSYKEVLNSSTLALCCKADGVPSPDVTWSKLSDSQNSGLPDRSLEVRDGCLTMPNMTLDDGGKYMCRASNDNGLVQAVTEVNMKALDELELSSILAGLDQKKYLEQLLSYLEPVLMDSVKSRFVRCYHAKTDGWAASTFHSNCDGKGPTVTIIQVDSYIFGGYTDLSWQSSCGYQAASKAFIYSLNNHLGSPVKLTQYRNHNNAMYSCANYGPTFGGGHDLYVSNIANTNTNSYTNLGHTYRPPFGFGYTSSQARAVLAGSYNFRPTDVEVFYETTS